MHITNISEAKANLSFLIKQVKETKKPIIIGKAGTPIAVLSAYNQNLEPRTLGGSWTGNVTMSDDFDDTPSDIVDSFYDSLL